MESIEEEDELALLDYRTPKGKLIKLLEQKMKKPEIDDSLGQVLDQFSQMTNEQTTFLENGIFHMNFAEDALLLQSCGQYYAKRVDKLWDELLQFHTRMVKYDETTAKNCTDRNKKEARQAELAKLEERLNRGKRKKIKLVEPESDTPQNGCYLFDTDQNDGQELFDRTNLLQPEEDEQEEQHVMQPFDYNFEIFDDWRDIHLIDALKKKKHNSVIVSQYNRQKYRLRNYIIPSGEEIIYDLNDPEEYNTKEGRLISVNHIRHLFEYNDRCLLPDEDFTIAKLRFGYVLKKKWLVRNKIDPDAPYETYKAEYEKYQAEYFANEKRKIQNMPQRNSEDLMKFYKVLEKKEQHARQFQDKLRKLGVTNLPEISFETLIVDPLKEGYQGDYDPYIPEEDQVQPVDEVQPVVPSQPPIDGDHEAELSNLFVGSDKLAEANGEETDKARSDSGYFDAGFEADDESDHEDNTATPVPGTDTPFEFDKDNTENKGDETTLDPSLDKTIENSTSDADIGSQVSPNITEDSEATGNNNILEQVELNSSNEESMVPPITEVFPADSTILPDEDTSIQHDITLLEDLLSKENDLMLQEIREFVKLGTIDENINLAVLEDCYFKKTDDMVMILYNKQVEDDLNSVCSDSQFDKIIELGTHFQKQKGVNKKDMKQKTKDVEAKENEDANKKSTKRKLESGDEPLAKRRKLSLKQIEKLRRSVIEPVKEVKWESFFSFNYQTEAGEGDISRVDYESASENEEDTMDVFEENEEVEHAESNGIEVQEEEKGQNELNASGYHSDHDGSHVSDHDYCRSETPALPLSQDSGIGIDISQTDCSQSTEKEVEASKPAASEKEHDRIEFDNIDLIAELSKNTGISREELSKQQEAEKPQMTLYEQQREQVRERVAEWKDYIAPKLKKLDEHDFDIHEYGSKIMNTMDIDESKPFSELVDGKSSAEVVRFFISSLQLANTMNVEICGAKQGQLSNDTFKLKLLSKERYHEHLQDYQAPSEEGLVEKLKKVKEIRMQNKMQEMQSNKKRKVASETQPPSIMKRKAERLVTPPANLSNNTKFAKVQASPPKKIKILNYSVMNPSTQQAFDFQQPSTSSQADLMERQNPLQSPISEITSPIARTPTRSSIDSGFITSCDEDTFLDQFDQLQQTSDSQLRSTPVKPRKMQEMQSNKKRKVASETQPPSIMKRKAERLVTPPANLSNNTKFAKVQASPPKKIKILNYSVMNPSTQQAFDFQQPSTSSQADLMERQNPLQSPISEITSPIARTPTRSSIDSGFITSCDEDTFLDQFDQLQQTSDSQLRSTPVKPRKVLRVSFARNTNF